MCGITGVLLADDVASYRARVVRASRKLRHRGPDSSGVWIRGHAMLAHERLSIVSLTDGMQPISTADGTAAVTANGEIYNHEAFRARHLQGVSFKTGSDCEVILHAWIRGVDDFLNRLNGDFAFVVSDGVDFLLARDPIGICPLYYGHDEHGTLWFASELKALCGVACSFRVFPPGHYLDASAPVPRPYYRPSFRCAISNAAVDLAHLLAALEEAIRLRLPKEVPFGVLLSGGLDSSLVAAIAARQLAAVDADGRPNARLSTFSVGMEPDAPDVVCARRVAQHIGSMHHEYTFSVQEGFDALEEVIETLESYDVTTVRSAVPMYLLARKIRAHNLRVILSGEGSDEVFGGYLYFHHIRDPHAFHAENLRLLDQLHLFDCLRANKATAAFSVEARVPFLDVRFLEAAFGFDPVHKLVASDVRRAIEKWPLRAAAETAALLPPDLLWRQKEQFSDGVGYGWINALQRLAEERVSDAIFARRAAIYPNKTPETKEGLLYRQLFGRIFGHHASAVHAVECWVPAEGQTRDPSGRQQRAHLHYQAQDVGVQGTDLQEMGGCGDCVGTGARPDQIATVATAQASVAQ